jgi:hypothetical protein
MRKLRGRLVGACTVIVVVAVMWSLAPAPQAQTPLATQALETLTVKGKAPRTGYNRDVFGPAWFDVDRNSCNTRDDILARDLINIRRSDLCRVTSGTLSPDPYTGKPLTFIRGKSVIDIDHVVALAQAWESGAWQWNYPRRVRFANDPLNLLAVSASANRQKGDREAAAWLPANRSYRCAFIARQVAVKAKYNLSVTQAEKSAMERVLRSCPNERLP